MKLHKRNSLISAKEAAKRFESKTKRVFEFFFQSSEIPFIHRDEKGKCLMEKETFVILKEITDIALQDHGKGFFVAKKEKSLQKVSLFTFIIDCFNFDKENPHTQVYGLQVDELNLDSVLEVDGKFETFRLIENNSNKVYHFGKSVSHATNGTAFNQKSKKLHTVNGFWRNQPYGSRNNPSYKRIWIDEFQRAS